MESKPRFEIAIEGSGLSPSDIAARDLAELLTAAAGLVEAVAKDRGVKAPDPRLVQVRKGSALYAFEIPDAAAQPIVDEMERRIRTRGEGAGPEVRRALDRLHRAGRGVGSVRFRAKPRAKAVYVAPLIAEALSLFDIGTELHGTVVGVTLSKAGAASVKLQIDEGTMIDLAGNSQLARLAARLFLRSVRATVSYDTTGYEDKRPTLVALDKWDRAEDEDTLDLFDDLRQELSAAGIKLHASEWLGATEQ